MTRKVAQETRDVYNGYQPTNRLYLKGPVVEEDAKQETVKWEEESLLCLARWSDGRTDYRVEKQKDGRWSWSVMEWAIDMDGNDYPEPFRIREGVEDTYDEACAHLSGFVTDPDHTEVVGFAVFEEPTDEELEELTNEEVEELPEELEEAVAGKQWGKRVERSVRKEMREVKRALVELDAFEAARYNSLVSGPGIPGCREQVRTGGTLYFRIVSYVTARLVDTGRRDEIEREMGFDPESERALEAEHAATRTRLLGGEPDTFWHPELDAKLDEIYGDRLHPYDDAVHARRRVLLARWNAALFDIRRRVDVWRAGWWAASYEVVDRRTGSSVASHTQSPISREDWLWLGVPDTRLLQGEIPLPSWLGVAETMAEEDVERERWCIEATKRLEERGEARRREYRAREESGGGDSVVHAPLSLTPDTGGDSGSGCLVNGGAAVLGRVCRRPSERKSLGEEATGRILTGHRSED